MEQQQPQRPSIVIRPGDYLENEFEIIDGARRKVATKLVLSDGRVFRVALGQKFVLTS